MAWVSQSRNWGRSLQAQGPGRAKAQLPAPAWEQVHQVPWERLAPDPKRDHEAGYWGAVQGTTAGKSGLRVFGHGRQALRAAVAQRPSSAMTVGSPEDSGCSAVLQGHGDPPPTSGSLFTPTGDKPVSVSSRNSMFIKAAIPSLAGSASVLVP